MVDQQRKSVLVTGAAGFIGSNLCRRLIADGYFVVGLDNLNLYYSPKQKLLNIKELLDNKNFKFVLGDVVKKEMLDRLFKKHKIDYIVHLAARAGVRASIEKPLWYKEVNVSGTVNLLELASQYHIKNFVFASSSSIYGEREQGPFGEDLRVDNPVSPYAASKKSSELFAYTYSYLTKTPITCLRFFTVYGPGNRPDMAMHLFVDGIYSERPIIQYGDGSTKRSYTYVDDIVDGIIKAINNPRPYAIYNLGGGEVTELKDLITGMEEVTGKQAEKKILPVKSGDVRLTHADTSLAQAELGWQPKTDLPDGLEKLFAWYKNNQAVKSEDLFIPGITKRVIVFSLNYEPFLDGAEMCVKQIAEKIDHYYFDIICIQGDNNLPKQENKGNIRIYRVGFGGRLDKFLYPMLATIKSWQLQRQSYDIVWGIMASYAGLAAMFYSWLHRAKFILSIQRGESEQYLRHRTWWWYPLYWLIHKTADLIHVSSSFQINRVKRLGYKKDIKLIPNGIGWPDVTRTLSRDDFSLSDNDRIVICQAGPIESNGAEVAIQAMADLADNFYLFILLTGNNRFGLDKLIVDRGLSERVRIIEIKSLEDITSHLQLADVYVRPLLRSGLPNFVLEAMLAKVPVVVSDVEGLNELVIDGYNGLLCKPKDNKDLVAKISQAVSDEDLKQEIIKNGYATISREFDWETTAEAMKQVFENI